MHASANHVIVAAPVRAAAAAVSSPPSLFASVWSSKRATLVAAAPVLRASDLEGNDDAQSQAELEAGADGGDIPFVEADAFVQGDDELHSEAEEHEEQEEEPPRKKRALQPQTHTNWRHSTRFGPPGSREEYPRSSVR